MNEAVWNLSSFGSASFLFIEESQIFNNFGLLFIENKIWHVKKINTMEIMNSNLLKDSEILIW